MDSRESFEQVVRLREEILDTKWAAMNAKRRVKRKDIPEVPMILAGNKCDREMKTVNRDEVLGYIAGQDNRCIFVECSARDNLGINDLFFALFMVANMPMEMSPHLHRRVVSAFGAPCLLPPPSTTSGGLKRNALSVRRRFDDACGVVTPNARRPSIRADLNLMQAKTAAMNEKQNATSSRCASCGIL